MVEPAYFVEIFAVPLWRWSGDQAQRLAAVYLSLSLVVRANEAEGHLERREAVAGDEIPGKYSVPSARLGLTVERSLNPKP